MLKHLGVTDTDPREREKGEGGERQSEGMPTAYKIYKSSERGREKDRELLLFMHTYGCSAVCNLVRRGLVIYGLETRQLSAAHRASRRREKSAVAWLLWSPLPTRIPL